MESLELDALAAAAAQRRRLDHDHRKRQEELEVTGVSRSGRVRKKSSKLMDFESPDDIDNSTFRRQLLPQTPTRHQYSGSRGHPEPHYSDNNGHGHSGGRGRGAGDDEDGSGSDSDFYDNSAEHAESMESDSSRESVDESGRSAPTPQHHSLYMMEKSKRRPASKDSRNRNRTRNRKDSGKPKVKARVTAYMLWSRDARSELLKTDPDLDFSSISKRLGEMWSNVNFQERRMWKLKAQRLAVKEEQEKQHANKIISNAAPSRPHATPASRPSSVRSQQKQELSPTTPPAQHQAPTAVYRVTGCGAAEVGAHLRLLGESLAIIGERLKEHEGQIAVSGSVSVLLDTLLCSLTPLVCVTRALPQIAPPADLMQDTLDNIAYIMPGL